LQILFLSGLNTCMKLSITKNDIRYGQRHNPSNCAIAQSIQRNLKKNKVEYADINVLPQTVSIQVFEDNKIVTYKTEMPNRGAKFVHRFDNELRVKPFSLSLPFVKTKEAELSK